jgi:type III restriction enzyme
VFAAAEAAGGRKIIETKGRVWEGTGAKDDAIRDWCERIAEATGTAWRYVRVNQVDFDSHNPATIADLWRP